MTRDRPAPGGLDGGPALRVVVVARQPVVRAGLRALLDERADVEVVGQASSATDAEDLVARLRPAVAVASWDATDGEGLGALCEILSAQGISLVLLVTEGALLSHGLCAGPGGILSAEATADDVAVALRAVARGLLVVDPLFTIALSTKVEAHPGEAPLEEPLTEREREVLDLLALGLPNKTIALRLGISEHTVKFHVGSIFAKLNVGSRTEAVIAAARRGLVAL